MAALVRRRVRTTPPTPGEALLIDWENPITRDLTLALSLADAAYGYSITGQNYFPYTSGAQSNTPQGTGGKTLNTTTPIFGAPSAAIANSTSYSLLAVGTCTSASVTQSALDMDNSSGSYRNFQFRVANGKADFIPFKTDNATVTGQCTAPVAMTVAEMSRGLVIGATASATRTAVFQNGSVTAGAPSGLQAPVLNIPLAVGARVNNSGQGWATGGLQMVATWARTLTDAEMRSLADNPWQLFRPQSRRLWFPRAVSVAYVLQASAGAFLLSASQAALSTARRLVASAGTLASSWSPANLVASRRLTGSPVTFAVTGSAASIRAARKLAANVGTFGLLGTPAPLVVARRLTAQPGAFVLSSGAVQMTYTPAQGPAGPTYVLGASAGSFGLGASAAQLKFNRRLQAATGSLMMAGSAAALRAARRLQADSANYAVAGSAVVLQYSGSAGQIDISKIPASRIVVFEGSGSRLVTFEGSGSRITPFDGSGSRVVTFEGSGSKTVRFE